MPSPVVGLKTPLELWRAVMFQETIGIHLAHGPATPRPADRMAGMQDHGLGATRLYGHS
jgi:hypothetical protein